MPILRKCSTLAASAKELTVSNSFKMVTALKNIVETSFKDIAEKFNLSVEDKSNRWEHVELYNDNCIIRFIDDFGSIEVSFVNPLERQAAEKMKREDNFPTDYPNYPIYFVWESLYPNDSIKFRTNSLDKTEQVLAAKKLVTKRFENIITGDFSWNKLLNK